MTRPPDVGQHLWWLASRASGVVALMLLSASVSLGLAMAARALPPRPGLKSRLVALHEHLSLAGLVAIAVHAITLLGDAWLRPGLAGIAVPFAMRYRPGFTGAGIVAGYTAAALGLGYYARRRIGARRWRRAHRFTVAAYALAVVHALGAGTDAGSLWLRVIVVAPAVAAVVLLGQRIVTSRPRRGVTPGTAAVPARPTAGG